MHGGIMVDPESQDKPKPADQVIHTKPGTFRATAPNTILWRDYSFAPEWFADAITEARSGPGHAHRRREILHAVCFVESYLFEWVRDDILQREFGGLDKYFPADDRRGIRERWKEVLKSLLDDHLLPTLPSFTDPGWVDFITLVTYRDGLVHVKASRPDTATLAEEQRPVPDLSTLDRLMPGWPVRTVVALVRNLHVAAGAAPPAWLVEP
jgi:hypothetical protein